MNTVFLNGEFLPRDRAHLSVDDRGFLFGDGVYEVTPAYGGELFRLARHEARLRGGLRGLEIDDEVGSMEAVHRELLARNDLLGEEMSVVYFQVTRGAAPRTHHFPPPETRPTVYAYAQPFPRRDSSAWEEGSAAVTIPDGRWARADLKTLQLLPSVLAQESARRRDARDAIFVRDGIALEGAHSNLFFVVDGTLTTHPASNQILAGITREAVLELAREADLRIRERALPVEELSEVSEVFLTGTTTEVRPVVRIDGRPVGDGTPGPITRTLHEAFLELVSRECGVTLRTVT